MNTPLAYTREERIRIMRLIVGLALISYPLALVLFGSTSVLSPSGFLRALTTGYLDLWFSYPLNAAAWATSHLLFPLACLWWVRRPQLRTWFFMVALGVCVSFVGAAAARVLGARYYYHPPF